MEKENSGSFEYMGKSFSELSVNDDSSAFSDCNSDRSGEFQTASSQNRRQKEIAVSILLQICEDNLVFRAMVTREGAIPPLVALTQSGTNRAKQKAETLIDLLRQPRSGNAAVGRTSDVSG
ncbi:U-BOX DOMAIN-CONTAINING PROTEIN 4-LIKE ISOFORM X1 [Salix purpurea]|uniref:U-BOX DOMAIN-CONTAINING PROTEIN 4-LIKE ISOFORM X1 n=1 Tax=Salix purpurea TaxID=77065 RepID=A0A9Q0SIS1_SALPP|nr:U-BOX DOMAIN-CONTAINING PROTEIN 4-LIKE ISOFORM X1 [Salix purpurea]